MNLELFSQKIYQKANKETQFDPQIIILIITVVIKLIQMYQECQKTPEEIHKETKKGLLKRLAIRKALRATLPTDLFLEKRKEYTQAIIDSAQELSLDDVKALILETESKNV